MPHSKPIADTAELVVSIGEQLSGVLCDHQAFFVLVLDAHAGAMPARCRRDAGAMPARCRRDAGAMPAVEDVLQRPSEERKRAAEVLRMWAARIEKGSAPETNKA